MVEALATSSITFTEPAAAVFTVRTAIERRPVIWIELELRIATSGPGAGSAERVGTGVADGAGVGLADGFAVAEAEGLGEGDPLGDGPGLVGATVGAGVGPGAVVGVGLVGAVAAGPGTAALGDGEGLGGVQHHQNQIGQPVSMLTPVAG
jgi:hypothetical protein